MGLESFEKFQQPRLIPPKLNAFRKSLHGIPNRQGNDSRPTTDTQPERLPKGSLQPKTDINSSSAIETAQQRLEQIRQHLDSSPDKNKEELAALISSAYPRIADYKLSKEDIDREPALDGFTSLADALAQRMIDSQDSKRELPKSNPGDLLPTGPEDWAKKLDALNESLRFKSPYLRANHEALLRKYRDLMARGVINMEEEVKSCRNLMNRTMEDIETDLVKAARKLEDCSRITPDDRAQALKMCRDEFKQLHADIWAALVRQGTLYYDIRNKLASRLGALDQNLDIVGQQEAAKRLMPIPEIVVCQQAFGDLIKILDKGFPHQYEETLMQAGWDKEWKFDEYMEKLMQDYMGGKLGRDERAYAEKLIQDYYQLEPDQQMQPSKNLKTITEAWRATEASWEALSEALGKRLPIAKLEAL